MLALNTCIPGLLPSATPLVWDSVFAPSSMAILNEACCSRGHSFTSVLDRYASPNGRTIVERALTGVLHELGDESRFVEYWWRGVHKSMETHRDVDEALCRSRKHAGTGIGVQRCPNYGHVLYLDVAPGLRAPTCVWEEEDPDEIWAREAAAVQADVRAGPPRRLRLLHVVPAVPGRLLRFRGDLLHAVPKPALQWLDSEHASVDQEQAALRSVVLFNTWSEPPMLPSPNDPPPQKAIAALAALRETPRCNDRLHWRELHSASLPVEGSLARLDAPLLGDELRRGCPASSLVVHLPSQAVEQLLSSEKDWHSIAVADEFGEDRQPMKSETLQPPWMGELEVNAAEELAVKLGYAEQLEAEFFGADDEEELDDEEEEVWLS